MPGASDNAILPSLSSPYTVALDIAPSTTIQINATNATLDVNGYSLTNASVTNGGRIVGLRGAVTGPALTNLGTGVIELAPGDSVDISGIFSNDGTILATTGSGMNINSPVVSNRAGLIAGTSGTITVMCGSSYQSPSYPG